MNNEKMLILVFRKENGSSFRFGVAFPDDTVEAASVKALGTALITNDILDFKDKSKLVSLEKAFYQVVQQNAIALD